MGSEIFYIREEEKAYTVLSVPMNSKVVVRKFSHGFIPWWLCIWLVVLSMLLIYPKDNKAAINIMKK